MQQLDITGDAPAAPPHAPFKDLRNTRPTIASQKAELALKLGALCKRIPKRVTNGSVQLVRDWQAAHDTAMKLLRSKSASVHALRSAISAMERYE